MKLVLKTCESEITASDSQQNLEDVFARML